MRIYVPEERLTSAPQWWKSERYDYCDMIAEEADTDNMVKRIFKKISHLFA
ncbi:MAG: hypothetical protein HUJ76_07605 [Parasporobacterium sp.]|nr:hypothetical protein [Parasporobacterium sp.]